MCMSRLICAVVVSNCKRADLLKAMLIFYRELTKVRELKERFFRGRGMPNLVSFLQTLFIVQLTVPLTFGQGVGGVEATHYCY